MGKQVATIVEGQLSVSTASGGDSHAIAFGKKLQAREVTWSHDSQSVAVIADIEGEFHRPRSGSIVTAPRSRSQP